MHTTFPTFLRWSPSNCYGCHVLNKMRPTAGRLQNELVRQKAGWQADRQAGRQPGWLARLRPGHFEVVRLLPEAAKVAGRRLWATLGVSLLNYSHHLISSARRVLWAKTDNIAPVIIWYKLDSITSLSLCATALTNTNNSWGTTKTNLDYSYYLLPHFPQLGFICPVIAFTSLPVKHLTNTHNKNVVLLFGMLGKKKLMSMSSSFMNVKVN